MLIKSMKNDAAMGRKKRMEIIRNAINKALVNSEFILKNKLVANCCISMGLSKKTVEEYIELIVLEQDLIERSGMIKKNAKDNNQLNN